ncbi:taurine dioxygenase, partial [Alcaligenes pakistanensis]
MMQDVDSPIAASRLDTRIMSPAIGVEVAGVDLTQPLEDTQVQELRSLLLKHQLLVFRD